MAPVSTLGMSRGNTAARRQALLDAGHAWLREGGMSRPPDYNPDIPTAWRSDPAAVAAVSWHSRAAAPAGPSESTERLNFQWTTGTPPPRSTRTDTTNGPMRAAFHRAGYQLDSTPIVLAAPPA